MKWWIYREGGEEVRNAKDDLALCNKATPGPWGMVEKDHQSCILTGGNKKYAGMLMICFAAEDMEFIIAAREALPYWIKRAEKLEKALDRACKLVEDATDNCPLGLDRDFDFDYCEEHCINDFAGCWKKYFLGGDK